MKPIHILGRGAIGSLLAARAIQAGISFTSEIRNGSRDCVKVHDTDNSVISLPPAIVGSTHPIDPQSIILIPLKAYQVPDAVAALTPRVSASNTIVLLHNGMLDYSKLVEGLRTLNIFACTTSYGAKKLQDETVITGVGKTVFGPVNTNRNISTDHAHKLFISTTQTVEDALNALLPPCEYQQKIETVIWRKLLINAVINPITAIHNIQNGELASPIYRDLIDSILSEAVGVSNRLGIQVDLVEVKHAVYSVIRNTANNYSSMHQDVAYGRKTEIDFISGYIVQQGKKLGIPVDTNESLLNQVKKRTQ